MKDNTETAAHRADADAPEAVLMQRLIDDPAAVMSNPTLRARIEADPTLQALAEDLREVSPALESLGREIIPPVPASLRVRVRQMAEASLTRRSLWTRLAEALWSPRGRLGFAAGAVCALLVSLGLYHRSVAPVGHLDFTASTMTLAGHVRTGDTHAALRRGDHLATDAQSAGLVSLGEGTRLALDQSSEVEILAANHLRLTQGRVFLRVRSQEGMMITLPDGTTVRDIGTIFGVDLASPTPAVDVIDGLVEVTVQGVASQVRAGEFLTLTAGTLAPGSRPEGTALPGWVTAILEEEQRTHVEQFVPSASGL